ncbi:MAG: hypothetical protein ABS95_02685 [Verrucomicrobia bacterium SCN 57-15]|nr:MAG: hypothetical protein ABS95_02685 [Verrucomicrobia bacterium SCN 57-15]
MKRNFLLLTVAVALSIAPARAQSSESPVQPIGAAATVFDYYFKIQKALAEDSLENVAVSAGAIAEIVRKDTGSGFAVQIVGQAETLAKARDVAAARTPFKALSGYLIHYAKTSHAVAGTYHEVHCPMANVNWLQNDDKAVRNPYLGKSMPQCGTFKS